ncbi:MAG: hypothetical protein AMXMBFR61_22640 [Fimbriimonadales bacterium]
MLRLSKHAPAAAPTVMLSLYVMLSLSKHDPAPSTLTASDTTIAAGAVMLRQAQHDGLGCPGCGASFPGYGASFPVTHPLQVDRSVRNRHGKPDVTLSLTSW